MVSQTATEMTEGPRCKLEMMSVPIDEPTILFCNTRHVVKSTARSRGLMKKTHNCFACRRACKACAGNVSHISEEDGQINLWWNHSQNCWMGQSWMI